MGGSQAARAPQFITPLYVINIRLFIHLQLNLFNIYQQSLIAKPPLTPVCTYVPASPTNYNPDTVVVVAVQIIG